MSVDVDTLIDEAVEYAFPLYETARTRYRDLRGADSTPGLQREPDGSLRIWIGHAAPVDPARRANWLPAPPGSFLMTMRAYRPREALRTWTAPMPRLSRLSTPGK